jgi:hypothetical protein
MEPHQIFPGGFIAGQAPGDQTVIGVQDTFYQIARPWNTRHGKFRRSANRRLQDVES